MNCDPVPRNDELVDGVVVLVFCVLLLIAHFWVIDLVIEWLDLLQQPVWLGYGPPPVDLR